jgi:hypothetical protein
VSVAGLEHVCPQSGVRTVVTAVIHQDHLLDQIGRRPVEHAVTKKHCVMTTVFVLSDRSLPTFRSPERCHIPGDSNSRNHCCDVLSRLPYSLTPYNTFLLQKLIVAKMFNKLPIFYGVRRFITVFTTARHCASS